MANEISWRHTTTGSNLYVTIRSAAHTYWSAATSGLEALTVANWANYVVNLSESPTGSYFYTGSWPTGLATPGWYWVDVYTRAGASGAISDTIRASLLGYWNGTSFAPQDANASTISSAAITSGAFASGALDSVWSAPTRTLSTTVSVSGEIFGTVVDGSYTFMDFVRLVAAALAGKISGADTNTPIFRDMSDTKDVIVATTDDHGNRLTITLDPT